MPTWRAISAGLTPASRSSRTLSAFALAVGALPLYLPSALALAIPTSIPSRVGYYRSRRWRSCSIPSRMVELDCSPMVLAALAVSLAGGAIVRRGRMFPCVELLIYLDAELPPSQLEPS